MPNADLKTPTDLSSNAAKSVKDALNTIWELPMVSGCRHSRIRYSKPGSSTTGIGSGEAGATAPMTIFASIGMNGD